jgi:hypothetical protein
MRAGKPVLRQLLAEDPYFVVRCCDAPQTIIKLRVSRLAKV